VGLTLKEYRSKYPQYDEIDDEKLARGLHKKYYPDIDWDEFSSSIEYVTAPVEPTEPTPQEQQDTAAKSMVKAVSTRAHGILGSGVFPRSEEEAIEQEMAVRKRVVDLDIYPAERYKFSKEDFDRLSGDRIQKAILARQAEPAEQGPAGPGNIANVLGERTGFEATPPDELTTPKRTERKISEDAGWWKFTKEATKSIPPLVSTGIEGISRMHDRLDAQNLSMGMVFLDRIASDYENVELGEDAEALIDEAAEMIGQHPSSRLADHVPYAEDLDRHQVCFLELGSSYNASRNHYTCWHDSAKGRAARIGLFPLAGWGGAHLGPISCRNKGCKANQGTGLVRPASSQCFCTKEVTDDRGSRDA